MPTESDLQSAISVDRVSVRYRIAHERIASFKEYAIRKLQRRVRHTDFWALKEVSLEVGRGEIVGIIGRNGAGKSTLLKLIARVLRPTEGRIQVHGNVAPLLEISAGLHPELTGRENVFLNGTLLGFTKRQMEEKFDRIVDFAELGEFIDAPLRTYSSGMVVRLGFSIATDSRPDILLVDEVLSVGDEGFQQKCTARIQQFCDQGATILMVSHDLKRIGVMCDRAGWIDQGTLRHYGPAADVVGAYLQAVEVR